MPFVEPEILEDYKCQNKNCNHMKISHNENGECELCACYEFTVPREMKPHWEKDPSKWTLRWICVPCHQKLFPSPSGFILGMTTKDPKECYNCGAKDKLCCLVDKDKIDAAK